MPKAKSKKTISSKTNFTSLQLLIVALLVAVVGAVILGTSFAAKPVKYPNATLVVTPNPVAVSSPWVASGCGYTPNDHAYFAYSTPYFQTATAGYATDANGCFLVKLYSEPTPQTDTAATYTKSKRGTLTVIKSVQFTVQ